MKKLILSLAVLAFFTVTAFAQIQTPAASPAAMVKQTVGLTDITVEFSRPGVKGRELFVDVEKWGQMWRTGANAATKITFSDDVKVAGKDVPAGTYAIYSIPGKENFEVMLYTDTKLGGNVAKYDKSKEQVRFSAPTVKMPMMMENFNVMFDSIQTNSAQMYIIWGRYLVPFKVETEVDSRVTKQIERVMAGPAAGDYYTAANYYYNNDKDINQAYTWIKMANEMAPRFWQLRVQALIEAKMGKYKDAIATAERSSAMAKESNNTGYPVMNAKSIGEWKTKM